MQTVMNEPLTFVALARSVWHDFRSTWRVLIAYDVLFKLLEAWLIVPAGAIVLATVLSQAGHIAVSNRDVLDFLLSPSGLLYAALFSMVAVALLLLEQAGIMALVSLTGSVEHPPVKRILLAAFLKTWRVAQLGAVKVALLALTFIPFTLLAVLTYGIFLSRHDINYYLTDRPPIFWLAAVIGVLLLLSALATGIVLYVRWPLPCPSSSSRSSSPAPPCAPVASACAGRVGESASFCSAGCLARCCSGRPWKQASDSSPRPFSQTPGSAR
jgi:glycerophosphoryl diester phosphodiesterase